jgi:hypothetical protein
MSEKLLWTRRWQLIEFKSPSPVEKVCIDLIRGTKEKNLKMKSPLQVPKSTILIN